MSMPNSLTTDVLPQQAIDKMKTGVLPVDRLKEMYRKMLLIRRVEESLLEMAESGKIGGAMHTAIGHEAKVRQIWPNRIQNGVAIPPQEDLPDLCLAPDTGEVANHSCPVQPRVPLLPAHPGGDDRVPAVRTHDHLCTIGGPDASLPPSDPNHADAFPEEITRLKPALNADAGTPGRLLQQRVQASAREAQSVDHAAGIRCVAGGEDPATGRVDQHSRQGTPPGRLYGLPHAEPRQEMQATGAQVLPADFQRWGGGLVQ